MKIKFGNYNVFSGTVAQCADEIIDEVASKRRNCKIISCLNPHSYAVARRDAEFFAALRGSDWLVPDGAGVILAGRWLGLQFKERVTGPDVFMATMERLNHAKGSVFFLGSSEKTLAKISERITNLYPSVVLAGIYSPPFEAEFSPEDNSAMVHAVNSASPDILWIGMTAPKQEKWLAAHRTKLSVGAAGSIGAAFDFFAGTVVRPPKIFRSLGLEWLPRLLQEPRRLWRRMFISAPIFIYDVLFYNNRNE